MNMSQIHNSPEYLELVKNGELKNESKEFTGVVTLSVEEIEWLVLLRLTKKASATANLARQSKITSHYPIARSQ